MDSEQHKPNVDRALRKIFKALRTTPANIDTLQSAISEFAVATDAHVKKGDCKKPRLVQLLKTMGKLDKINHKIEKATKKIDKAVLKATDLLDELADLIEEPDDDGTQPAQAHSDGTAQHP